MCPLWSPWCSGPQCGSVCVLGACLRRLSYVVLDEVDRVLRSGMEEQIREVGEAAR